MLKSVKIHNKLYKSVKRIKTYCNRSQLLMLVTERIKMRQTRGTHKDLNVKTDVHLSATECTATTSPVTLHSLICTDRCSLLKYST